MNNPIISVIVPAYNASTYIEKCVNSILSSTIKAIEVIVVDDKSEDNTLELLGQFNDNRLKVIPENIRGGYRMQGIEALTMHLENTSYLLMQMIGSLRICLTNS